MINKIIVQVIIITQNPNKHIHTDKNAHTHRKHSDVVSVVRQTI